MFSRHMLYILYNDTNNSTYNGYTVDFDKRLRKHNCEIKGGARFTTNMVKSKHIVWKPLVLIRIPNEDFDEVRALSLEWSIHYPDNKRPRPAKFTGYIGRLVGLGLVFNNPKFLDLYFNVKVFSQDTFDIMKEIISGEDYEERVDIDWLSLD